MREGNKEIETEGETKRKRPEKTVINRKTGR